MNSLNNLVATSLTWLANHAPGIYTLVYAAGISALMTLRDGKSWLHTFTSACVCGLIALSLVPVLRQLGLPDNVAPAIGPLVGFIGADKLREIIISVLTRRAKH